MTRIPTEPKPKRQPRPYLLIVGVLALAASVSRLFRSPLQAWYQTLSPHSLTIVKVVVLMTFLVGLPLLFIFLSGRDPDA